jgi:hypothetical protein
MAKPKQSKYSRARVRSRVRRPKQNASRGWLIATTAVVVVGVLLVVLSVADRRGEADVLPRANQDHWHAYLGVNICGTWQGPVPQFEFRDGSQTQVGGQIQAGIHSHGDYLIHDHPFASDESGDSATLGRYLDYAQTEVTATSIRLWDQWAPGVDYSNGDKCPPAADGGTKADAGKPGKVFWKVGRFGEPWPEKARTGDPAKYHIENGDIIALYFVPEGTDLEQPPGSDEALRNISDLSASEQLEGPQNPATSSSTEATTDSSTSSSSDPAESTTSTTSG